MVVAIPIYDGIDMLDVVGPYEMFTWTDLHVQIIAERSDLVTCRGGLVIQPHATFALADICDVLWVPGGEPDALTTLIKDPQQAFLDFLVRQSQTARYVASVCEGALLLAAAGLLDGYEATTHWAFVNCFVERFPKIRLAQGQPRFVLDQNRLTGGGISSGLDEALKLISLLFGESKAQ